MNVKTIFQKKGIGENHPDAFLRSCLIDSLTADVVQRVH